MKMKCDFCGIEHWDWFHHQFHVSNKKLAQMDHDEMLSALIRGTEKLVMERTEWESLCCYLNYNIFVLSESKNHTRPLYVRNIGIFKELLKVAELHQRMKYIELCRKYQEDLYNSHLEIHRSEV